MAIRARPLHAQVRQVVLERIIRSELEPGSRVVESRLAEELGVSRTPLREALMHLEREDFLELQPNRGFFVTPLSLEEASEIYPVVALLEGHALRLTGPPDAARAGHLGDINDRLLSAASDPERAFTLHTEWHTVLTSGCPNRHLLKMLASIRRKVYRYEWAHSASGPGPVEETVTHHDRILGALARADMEAALELLQQHWRRELAELGASLSDES